MQIQTVSSQAGGIRQLRDFLTVLSSTKTVGEPLLKRAFAPHSLMRHLEQELPVEAPPVIFRRLGRHTQLCIHFS